MVLGWVKRPPRDDLDSHLIGERDRIRGALGEAWWKAALGSLGKWFFDYLALLMALSALGAEPRPALVLLAYTGAAVLSMVPITPGGLGFVEAGLTALLALAGVSAGDAVVATLSYRLVSYWLPLLAGGVAGILFRARYHARTLIVASDDPSTLS